MISVASSQALDSYIRSLGDIHFIPLFSLTLSLSLTLSISHLTLSHFQFLSLPLSIHLLSLHFLSYCHVTTEEYQLISSFVLESIGKYIFSEKNVNWFICWNLCLRRKTSVFILFPLQRCLLLHILSFFSNTIWGDITMRLSFAIYI